MPGKCNFNPKWLDNPDWWWLESGSHIKEAKCSACKKSFSLNSMGVSAVVSHAKGKIHGINVEDKSPKIGNYFSPQKDDNTKSKSSESTAESASQSKINHK